MKREEDRWEKEREVRERETGEM